MALPVIALATLKLLPRKTKKSLSLAGVFLDTPYLTLNAFIVIKWQTIITLLSIKRAISNVNHGMIPHLTQLIFLIFLICTRKHLT